MYKVLHIYSKENTSAARYVSRLTDAMKGMVVSASCDDKADFAALCAEVGPDIVHVHGNVGIRTEARKVLSTDGAALTDSDYYALIARSRIEANRLKAPRTEIIRNPLITKTTTFESAARSMMAVYQKVMDSNPLPLLSQPVRQLLGMLLKAGILGDRRWAIRTPNDSSIPTAGNDTIDASFMTPTDFRLLYIYSDLEGVLPIVERGIGVLRLQAPQRETAESYLPADYSKPASMAGRTIPEMLHDLQQNGPSLCRLADIFAALYDPHLREDELNVQLQQSELKPLFMSVLQILTEVAGLDEGFMPCPPADNRLTQQQRNLLTNHLRL